MRKLNELEKMNIENAYEGVVGYLEILAAELNSSQESGELTTEYEDLCELRLAIIELGQKYRKLWFIK